MSVYLPNPQTKIQNLKMHKSDIWYAIWSGRPIFKVCRECLLVELLVHIFEEVLDGQLQQTDTDYFLRQEETLICRLQLDCCSVIIQNLDCSTFSVLYIYPAILIQMWVGSTFPNGKEKEDQWEWNILQKQTPWGILKSRKNKIKILIFSYISYCAAV